MMHYNNLSLELLTDYDDDGNFHVEEFKDIVGYEGLYQISTFGRVKRLGRYTSHNRLLPTIILRPFINKKGYCESHLRKEGAYKHALNHRLVAIVYIPNPDNKPEVNHIDEIKKNNCVWNLGWATRRENETYHYLIKKTTSIYTGVHWCKSKKKWATRISYNAKTIHLGYFNVEYDAHLAYQKALKEINEGIFILPTYTFSSKYKGVCWDKKNKKWMGKFRYNKIDYNIGRHLLEIDAYNAVQNKLKELKANDINL